VTHDVSRVGTSVVPEAHHREWQAPVGVRSDTVEVKNRVQFGPILAGVLTAIATLLILTVLGLAIGSSALEPRDVGEKLGTGAAIWGIASALIAFFVGGWVAAKTAAVAGTGSGMINGLMVGAAILALVLWLTGSGVSGILGTVGSNIGDITNVVNTQGVSTEDAQQQAQSVDPQQAFSTVKDGAWWTLLGLILPLAASAAGGLLGHNDRRDVIQTGR
jgi:heme A synthase